MYKFGTVAELEALNLKGKLPDVLYQKAMEIVVGLDEYFGEDRDVDNEDGGFLVVALNAEDLSFFAKNCVDLEAPGLEYVEFIHTEKETYLNAFFLVNEYEFGMTLFVPMSIAPERFVKEAEASTVHR